MKFSRLCLLCWLVLQLPGWPLAAQQVQFPGSAPGALSPPPFGASGTQLAPPVFTSPNATPWPSGFGAAPTYPPPNTGGWFGSNASSPFGSWFTSQPPPAFNAPQGFGTPPQTFGAPPAFGTPGATPGFSGSPPAIFSAPAGTPYGAYGAPPPGAYPGAYPGGYPGAYGAPGANTLFPNGLWGPNAASSQFPFVERFRFLRRPRLSDTYIYGSNKPDDLQTHDIEVAITGALPNFLISSQPVYITPTYVHHLWDGPHSMDADLPGNAFSAFLDFFWASDPNRPLGAELGVAVGGFSDFDTFTSDSIRVLGEGFGVVRLTPQLTFKFGVWYLNRNDLKLLPAGGLVWQPTPQLKFDLLFPNPKISRYLTSGPYGEVRGYLSGEYGGGAWTIRRTDGSGDRVDINDIRVKLGIDWVNQRNWSGFAEIGYVFEREVVYVVDPNDTFSPGDSFLIGAGFSF
jgi:hypothetical protein